MVTSEQKDRVLKAMEPYMEPDKFGRSTVRNIYFDTADNRLIRTSVDGPAYKEKLRIRSYKRVSGDGDVFVELKKKYDGIVYKRREGMDYRTARLYLDRGFGLSKTSQIISELDYFKKFYENLEPSILIMCDREAYVSKEDESLRLTFDQNILFRDENLNLDTEAW
jgi:SPX domain protein involved in polyphosphate accumulation